MIKSIKDWPKGGVLFPASLFYFLLVNIIIRGILQRGLNNLTISRLVIVTLVKVFWTLTLHRVYFPPAPSFRPPPNPQCLNLLFS